MDGLQVLLAQWAALGGFGALIAFLVNILKTFGLVKDDQAVTWSTGLNLLGLAGLLFAGIYSPEVDLGAIDAKVGEFVQVGLVVFAYIVQLLGSKLSHATVRGVPLIGKSYSK